MTTVLCIAILLLLAAAIAAAVIDRRRQREGVALIVGRRVVVQTRDKQSISGVLVATYSDCLALEKVEILASGSARQAGGQSLIPRTNVAWMQFGVEAAE